MFDQVFNHPQPYAVTTNKKYWKWQPEAAIRDVL